MAPKSNPWKLGAISSAVLVLICLAAEYVDEATHFRYEFISDYFDWIGIALLVGTISLFITLLAWAKHLDRPGRLLMSLAMFLAPWTIVLIGYPIAGFNVHGAAAIVMLFGFPASILAVVLLVMASMAKSKA